MYGFRASTDVELTKRAASRNMSHTNVRSSIVARKYTLIYIIVITLTRGFG